jgi:hypothetical protein
MQNARPDMKRSWARTVHQYWEMNGECAKILEFAANINKCNLLIYLACTSSAGARKIEPREWYSR